MKKFIEKYGFFIVAILIAIIIYRKVNSEKDHITYGLLIFSYYTFHYSCYL